MLSEKEAWKCIADNLICVEDLWGDEYLTLDSPYFTPSEDVRPNGLCEVLSDMLFSHMISREVRETMKQKIFNMYPTMAHNYVWQKNAVEPRKQFAKEMYEALD